MENDILIRDVAIYRRGTCVSHLFFVDDSIIFCKVSNANCVALQNILELYENASGQKVNGDKTTLFFNYNTPMTTKDSIVNFLVLHTKPNLKNIWAYLLSLVVQRNKLLMASKIGLSVDCEGGRKSCCPKLGVRFLSNQ